MAGTPTFATSPFFLGVEQCDRDARFVVAGVPLDIGTTNRSDVGFGPQAIRHARRMLVDGSAPAELDRSARAPAAGCGRLHHRARRRARHHAAPAAHAGETAGTSTRAGASRRACRYLARQFRPVVRARLGVHAIEEGTIDPARMVQVGIRSPVQREVWEWTLAKGVTILSAQDVHEEGPERVAQRIRDVVGDVDTYLSFDIDTLYPAAAPGTGTPEIGGLTSWQAQAILRRLGGLRWAGTDVVEVTPAYDVSEITALAAATMVWEYLALVGASSA